MASHQVNPIIPGFGPDPSICRVEDIFYLANSTFHFFPGLPIYVSKNLVDWTLIGNAINRRQQLNLNYTGVRVCPQNDGATLLAIGGLHAPTIRYKGGTFYIVCTNVTHSGGHDPSIKFHNFIVSTTDIWANSWSDPVSIELHGFDPSLFFDDDGKSYIQGAEVPGPNLNIIQYEVDLATGHKLSGKKVIYADPSDFYPEGPHMYKKDGWFYLLFAEGGTHEQHNVKMARSRDVWGPFDPCDHNPVLTARGTNEYAQHVGHADFVQDTEGSWWAVCLAVRKAGERYAMGRETFLVPFEWPTGEWPTLIPPKSELPKDIRLPQSSIALPAPKGEHAELLFIRDSKPSNLQIGEDGSDIKFSPGLADFPMIGDGIAFVGKRQPNLVGTAFVSMYSVQSSKGQIKAGLALYKDELRYARLCYDTACDALVFEVVNSVHNIFKSEKHPLSVPDGGSVELQLLYTETSYEFFYRPSPNVTWVSAGGFDTLVMTAFDFAGPVIGVFALANKDEDLQVDFSSFRVDLLDKYSDVRYRTCISFH